MRFDFNEETDEFPLVVACLARACNGGQSAVSLLERMKDTFTASEMVAYHKYYAELTFSTIRRA